MNQAVTPMGTGMASMAYLFLRIRGDAPFVVLTWLVLTLAAGFRVFGHDLDYLQYQQFYLELDSLDFSAFRYEPGFILFSWLSKCIFGLNFTAFLTLIVGVSLAVKFYLLRQGKYFWPLIGCYFLSLYLIHEMTQIRAALGISFAFLATFLFHRRRIVLSVVLFLLAFSMHYSTGIFALFIAISRVTKQEFKYPPLAIFALVGIAALFVRAVIDSFAILNPLIAYYSEEFEGINLFSIRNVLVSLFVLAAFYNYKTASIEARSHMAFLVAGLLLFVATSSIPPVAHRLLELTMFSMFIISSKLLGIRALFALSILAPLAAYLFYRQEDYSLFFLF